MVWKYSNLQLQCPQSKKVVFLCKVRCLSCLCPSPGLSVEKGRRQDRSGRRGVGEGGGGADHQLCLPHLLLSRRRACGVGGQSKVGTSTSGDLGEARGASPPGTGSSSSLVSPSLTVQGMHWAGRVSDHCHYLIGHQRMDAAELYDLWLRAGYRATEEWVKFLCEVNVTATPHPPSSHRVKVCSRIAWRSCRCTPGRQRTASRLLLPDPSSSPRTSDSSAPC